MIRILSFGAGVQSQAVARMSLDGILPPLDHLIFADTGAEWPETYEAATEIENACHNRGVGFHRVTNHYERSSGSLFYDLEGDGTSARWSSPPLHLDNSDVGGRPALAMRQCTGDFKLDPIMRKTRELAGIPVGGRGPKGIVVETWLGISLDERQRMKTGSFRWHSVWHPLIEGPEPMTRWDCALWLGRQGYRVPVKSACVFCPYQSDRRWLRLADEHPETFARVDRLDGHLRTAGNFKGTPYLHRSLKPVGEVVERLRREREASPEFDVELFDDECGGVCGV